MATSRHLPAAVKARFETVAELHSELFPSDTTAPAKTGEQVEAPVEADKGTPPETAPDKGTPPETAPDKGADAPKPDSTPEPTPTPEPEAAVVDAPADTPSDTPAETKKPEDGTPDGEVDFEQKFNTLKGIHGADLNRKDAEIEGLKQRLRLIAAAQPSQEETGAQATPAPAEPITLSDKEKDDIGGDEALAVFEKLLASKTAPVLEEVERLRADNARLTGQLVPQVQGVAGEQAAQSQAQYLGNLDVLAPDWREVNADPKFVEWGKTRDAASGLTYSEMVVGANTAKDARRIASIITLFKADSGTPSTASAEPAKTGDTTQPLSASEAPAKGKAVPPPTQPAPGEKLTRSKIREYSSNISKGRYRDNPAELKRIRTLVNDAIASGNITDD